MQWGCYPMVPFAGRLRHGRLIDGEVVHQLPVNLAPHAIHGYGFVTPWQVVAADTITFEFGDPWPFAGRATQHFALDEERLVIHLEMEADEAQPLIGGWHPWFRRDIGVGSTARLFFEAGKVHELDDEAIPTGGLVDPPPPPWDHCFTAIARQPEISWGDLCLSMSSDADHWVVYTEPAHALCVEPQTHAPDAGNRGEATADAGSTVTISFELRWA